MTHTSRHILLIEDNAGDARLVTLLLAEGGLRTQAESFEVTCVTRLKDVTQLLQARKFDAALVDLGLPDSAGLATLRALLRVAPYLPIIVLSGLGDEDVAVEAVKSGAQDYLVKGSADSRLLVNAIRYAIERKQRARTLEAIADVTRDMRAAHTVQEVYQRVIDRLLALFGNTECLGFTVEPDSGDLCIVVARGRFAPAVGTIFDRSRGLSGELVAAGTCLTTTLHIHDPRSAFPQYIDVPLDAAGVPMLSEGDAVGGLLLFREHRTGQPFSFSEDDQTVLLAVADIAASAVKRAYLTATTEVQKEQLQTVVDTVAEGLLLLDDQYHVLLTNQVADTELTRLAEFGESQTLRRLGGMPLTKLVQAARPDKPVELRAGATPGTISPDTIFEVRAYPVHKAATVRGWLLSLRDVTEERRRHAREQQQARMAAVGQMAAGIAHQFNNSLASIVLYGDLLARSTGISPDDQRRLHIILREARLTADLIQQLLDFSHQALMVRSHFDLVPFISRLLDIWMHTLPETIVVAFECSDEAKLVRADPARLQQALMNLVAFAEKSMPTGGTLWLAVESTTYAEETPMPELAPGTYAVITLKHSGTPIPPAVLPHIFEPFYIGEGITPTSGLSLAQVYGIIAQHDGAISVTSDAAEGIAFTIYLPLVIEPGSAPIEPSVQVSPTHYATTLIVLDDPALLRQLQVRLSGRGRRVLTSTSGLDALRRYSVDLATIDLVVTTPELADITGDELWRVVRDIAPKVRAMFLTTERAAIPAEITGSAVTGSRATWQPLPVSGADYETTLAALVNQILTTDTKH